ncbi:Uncharacterised protein [uncultured archaeon]|nr:Uncharacterised protein [uncultured archaeon]
MLKHKSRKIDSTQRVLEKKPTKEDLNYIWNTGALEKKAKERGSEWYYDTFGVTGTILSALFSLAFLGIGILVLDYFARETASAILAGIRGFLLANVDVFFLIFLLTSFITYCSKRQHGVRLVLSPFAGALGTAVFFWTAANITLIANAGTGNIALFTIADSIRNNLLAIFGIFLTLGYLIVLSKPMFEGISGYMCEKAVASQEHEPNKTYRSKQN